MAERGADQPESQRSREDLYREWLGVTSPAPTYYDLLGVPPMEWDSSVILQAAREVKRKIRAYQIGRYRKEALGLLSDVGQAVSVLTSPPRRRAYDNELLGHWREGIEALYDWHCTDRPHEPETLEAWLVACRERGVPVSRLIPSIVRFLKPQMDSWPPRGEHGLNLPKGLWIYRDAVILGSCLDDIPLEQRAEVVKGLQKALGVPERLARVVAEEVTQESRLLERLPLVREAREDPAAAVLRMGRRVRRLGGRLDAEHRFLAAVGALVGLGCEDVRRLVPRLQERPAAVSPWRRAALSARRAGRGAARVWRARGAGAAEWFAERPAVLLALAIAVGLAALVVAILVVSGVWQWGGQPAPVAPSAPAPPEAVAPPEPPAPEPPPADLEGWDEFRRKYPVESPLAPPPTVSPDTSGSPPSGG